jgi:hypothetical protein
MTSASAVANGVKALVYADSGMGKTLMCATAPAPIVISAESGLLVLNKKNIEKVYGVATPGITYDLPVIKITTVQDLNDALQWLMTPQAANFQTVCIDSISEIGEVVLNNAKRQVKDPRQAYGELIEKMESVIRAYRDLPGKNVYMTAKLDPMKDELTGIVRYGPSMPGAKLGQKLPYFFDEVFKLGVNKDQTGASFRYLQTSADLQNMAKDRSGALDVMEPPHLAYVFNKILQGA